MLEENEHNFPVSKRSKMGFSHFCKSCYDGRYGKKDDGVPDGHQRCKGECGQVLKLSEKNFVRDKTSRSGFRSKCADRARMLNRKRRKMQREATSPRDKEERDREKICPTVISDVWESAVEC